MSESRNPSAEREVTVPAATQRAGEAYAAMLAEVFETVRAATGNRSTERSDNLITPTVPTGLGIRVDAVNPQNPNPQVIEFNNIFAQVGYGSERQFPISSERPAIVPAGTRADQPTRIFTPPRPAHTPEAEQPAERAEPYRGARSTVMREAGARTDTRVRIGVDRNGIANTLTIGNVTWRSTDGLTWTTGNPEANIPRLGIRHGRPSIDAQGNFTFHHTAYGVTATNTREGNTTHTMTTSNGERYSVTTNNRGEVTTFTEGGIQWNRSSQPNPEGTHTWTNERGDVRQGRVELTQYGDFSFSTVRPDGTIDRTQRQSQQRERIQQAQDELTARYGITFALPGARRNDEGVDYTNGVPTLRELATLRSVLERTSHVDYTGVRMWFTDAAPTTDHYGHYSNTGETAHGEMVITPRARFALEGFRGLEGTLFHELGHHEQGVNFGFSDDHWGVGGPGPQNSREVQDEIRPLGWIPSTLRTRNEANQRVDGRAVFRDAHGGHWVMTRNEVWQRVRGNVDANGVLTRPRLGWRPQDFISNNVMSRIAAVRPGTTYNHHPDEGHIDSMALFRMGTRPGENARTLFERSPELYRVLQAQDHAYMNRTRPGTMRGADGEVVPDNPANRGLRLAEEMRWSIEAARSQINLGRRRQS